MEEQLEQEIQDLFDGVEIPYSVQLQVDKTNAGEKIVQVAARKGMDLIFLGLKKHSKVGKLLFGSTAQYVILNAPCPVMTINAV
ncbi:MAG: universal stress protein [Deltaproteobacteria bacterium]|nr:universal stress protein [Deltaproteobacteria bacterium]